MGFFDRFYYGKAGKHDYTEMDMPKSRVSLFFLVFKERFFDLIKLNLLQVVFWIPMLLWTLLNIVMIQSIDAETMLAQENGAVELLSTMGSYLVAWLIGLIPCVLITGPSSAGAAYVMRNWSRDQHAFLFSDFKDAFKSNWKQALAVSAITCLLPLVVYTAVTYYGEMAKNNVIMYIPLVIVLSAMLMWILMLPLLYPMMIGYELRFKDLVKNAFLMAAASLPKVALARVITLIPIVAMIIGVYLGNVIVMLIVALYYLLIGFALSRLVYASFANDIFDRFLNSRIEGAETRMGLRPQEDDEEEEDDEDEDEEADEEG